ITNVYEKVGYHVIHANLINDRGIHICKSMLTWIKAGKKDTPETTGKKGDHLVGDFYVEFANLLKPQLDAGIANGLSPEEAERQAPVMQEAQELLRKWEANDPEVHRIWKQMNDWVLKGFNQTYQRMGIRFDKIYFESETYLVGKQIVQEGLANGIFYTDEKGAILADLSNQNLNKALLLRADGTSVYLTQDLGTAEQKHQDYQPDISVYVIGNEQDYHMKVLKAVLQLLKKTYADTIFHLSYGMVELTSGKMKSREGTVVDADDLLDEVHQTAKEMTQELGKIEGMSEQQLEELYEILGQGALKYYLLKVDPQKRIVYDPKESVSLTGQTGVFIQYSGARIHSLLRKAKTLPQRVVSIPSSLEEAERILLKTLLKYPLILEATARRMDPAMLAQYLYDVAKSLNRFWHDVPVLKSDSPERTFLRIEICKLTLIILQDGMKILGIQIPERM
ncbi:MAG: arginine--tRNA ligase, partial [Bacteroidia bacterium]|nr:arginine--tRNA ligase [Bacteroidia bacterium]